MGKNGQYQQLTTQNHRSFESGGDWETKKLGNIGIFSKGKGLSKIDIREEGIIPAIPYTSIFTDFNEITSYNMVSTYTNSKDVKTIASPHLLIAGSSNMLENVGKTTAYISKKEIAVGGDIILFNTLENVSFISYLLNSKPHRKKIIDLSQGSTIRHVYISTFKNYEISLPPTMEEQCIVAEVLLDVDALITALDKLITKKRDIKTATMQQLLTGKKRLPGFSGEWQSLMLGNICDIINGGTPSTSNPSYWNGKIPWCIPTDITSSGGKYLLSTERKITDQGLQNSSAILLPIGALLLCTRATIGEVKIAIFPVATNQGFKSLVCNQNTNHEFIYYLLLTLKPKLVEKGVGSTFLEVSKKDIKTLEINLPVEEREQKEIAKVLSDIDNEISLLEKQRNKIKSIKNGLMQELLTGRLRLV